ncbi:DUF6197 family protein [Paractinoplanes globisporus]|uniref:Uncharacterized protein n=1 Tax=Paractinoplanes globisporus TaxID=113565 RepID=A0ABW6WJB4_9ACTN|nr:hypothetical protein [Actinoplanes globisporus]
MNPTHDQESTTPEPASPEPTLFGTVTRGGIFKLVRRLAGYFGDAEDRFDITEHGLQALAEAEHTAEAQPTRYPTGSASAGYVIAAPSGGTLSQPKPADVIVDDGCDVPHDADEPCRYESCTGCGSTYTFGPSIDPLCGMCAEAERADVCRNCGDPMLGWYSWSEMLCPSCVAFVAAHPGETATGTVEPAPAGAAPGNAAWVLSSAARYLERHGWIQGAYYDGTTGVFTPPADMVGAIAMVCYGGPCEAPAQHFDDPGFLDFEEAVLHLDRYLLAEDGSESYEFNDAPGRRVEDVTRVLRDAASRPADDLIDTLRIVSDTYGLDQWLAERARLLTPSGIWADPDGQPGEDLVGYCELCDTFEHTANPAAWRDGQDGEPE